MSRREAGACGLSRFGVSLKLGPRSIWGFFLAERSPSGMAAAADMRYMQRMPKSTVERVRERRDKLRAAGLRPVQIWLPDTTAPGFADEAARQARLLAEWEASPAGRQEMAFWDALAAETWDDEPD